MASQDSSCSSSAPNAKKPKLHPSAASDEEIVDGYLGGHLDHVCRTLMFYKNERAYKRLFGLTPMQSLLLHRKTGLAGRVATYIKRKGETVVKRNSEGLTVAVLDEALHRAKSWRPCVILLENVEKLANDVVDALALGIGMMRKERVPVLFLGTSEQPDLMNKYFQDLHLVPLKELEDL